jgi:hypothetical protein
MKLTDGNRSLVFLAGTLILGVLIISVLLFVESNDVEGVEIVDEPVNTNFKVLETKIDDLRKQNFNPNNYNTLATEIDASYQQELITGSAKSNLVTKLTSVYSDLVYKQTELFLTSDVGTSLEVLTWLNQLERITSKNPKIDTYRSQIKWYNYYATTLPNKVEVFINNGNYTDEKYSELSNELKNMAYFKPVYKNRLKFNNIRKNLMLKLDNFNADYYSIKKIKKLKN